MRHIQQSIVLEGDIYLGKFEGEKESFRQRRGIRFHYSDNTVLRHCFTGEGLIEHKFTGEMQRFEFKTKPDNYYHWNLEESLIEFREGAYWPYRYPELSEMKERFVNPKKIYDLVLEQMFEDSEKLKVKIGLPKIGVRFLNIKELSEQGKINVDDLRDYAAYIGWDI